MDTTLGGRVRTARKRLGLTQQELAKASGLKQSDISKIEAGAIQRTTAVPALARALLCDTHWLDTGEGSPGWDHKSNITTGPAIRGEIPLISWIQAGQWSELVGKFETGDAEQWIGTTAQVSGKAFALRMQGDSMAPKVPDGSIVIFDPDRAHVHGSLVLARRAGSPPTFKQLWLDGDAAYLRPLNERYPVAAMPADFEIIAVAVRLELDL